MLQTNHIFGALIRSGWRGAVVETGLGVPFQDGLLRFEEGGASKVLKFGMCPYSREFQPKVNERSVSRGMAVALANRGLEQVLVEGGDDGKVFCLAVTGAYKGPAEHGETHGWIGVATWTGRHMSTNTTIAHHFWVPKGTLRSDAIDAAGFATALAVFKMLGEPTSFVCHSESAQFDVVDGVDMKEHVGLCHRNNPLVHVPGPGFVRAKDWLRRPGLRIFRGSFNPPHRAHERMGAGCLWAIDFENARKETVSSDDMAHRVWMANLVDAPVLVTYGLPRFVDFHKAVLSWGAEAPVRYVVGADTLAAIVDPKHCDGQVGSYLSPLKGSAIFEVYPCGKDGGTAETLAARAEGLLVEPQMRPDHLEQSRSTLARGGAKEFLNLRVAAYVDEHGLYKKK